MDHLEMVEKLREKANVTYDEARTALEVCNWDLLDALLLLENEGKLNETPDKASSYSTRVKDEPKSTRKCSHRANVVGQVLHALAGVVKKCNSVTLQIKKQNEVRLALPMTAVILLVVFAFWFALAIGFVAMLCGYRFSVIGLSFDDSINDAMEKAGDFVDKVIKPEDVQVVYEKEQEDAGSKE